MFLWQQEKRSDTTTLCSTRMSFDSTQRHTHTYTYRLNRNTCHRIRHLSTYINRHGPPIWNRYGMHNLLDCKPMQHKNLMRTNRRTTLRSESNLKTFASLSPKRTPHLWYSSIILYFHFQPSFSLTLRILSLSNHFITFYVFTQSCKVFYQMACYGPTLLCDEMCLTPEWFTPLK